MNVEEKNKYIGYLKYTGESVKDGMLDARKASEALLGFDEVFRYFLVKEDPDLLEVDFDVPVRVDKGSWIIGISSAVIATVYLSAIANKAGSDGFLETGPVKDFQKILTGTLKSIQWVVNILKHQGVFSKKLDVSKVRVENALIDSYVGLENEDGELLQVPKKYYDLYEKCPDKLFEKSTGVVESNRTLQWGVIENGKETKVNINIEEKYIFCKNEDDVTDYLFPELLHDQFVELEGEIIKATESTNSIGLKYKGHVLICKPVSGNISEYKKSIISQSTDHFFPKAVINGQINRHYNKSGKLERKPQILFSEITPIEEEKSQKMLIK